MRADLPTHALDTRVFAAKRARVANGCKPISLSCRRCPSNCSHCSRVAQITLPVVLLIVLLAVLLKVLLRGLVTVLLLSIAATARCYLDLWRKIEALYSLARKRSRTQMSHALTPLHRRARMPAHGGRGVTARRPQSTPLRQSSQNSKAHGEGNMYRVVRHDRKSTGHERVACNQVPAQK